MTRLVSWIHIPIIRRFKSFCSRFIGSTRIDKGITRYLNHRQDMLDNRPIWVTEVCGRTPGNDPVMEDEHYE